ncbi:MAG: PAS domain S-box protein, partial [Thermodesulfobacteriota bacterium]
MVQDEPLPILLVEDNPADARFFREALREARASQFALVHVEHLGEALTRLQEGNFAAVLLDLSLPDSFGFDTISRVQACAPQVPIVVLTGLDDEEFAVKVVQEGAQDYLVKGQVEPGTLVRALRYAIERQRLRQAVQASEERYRNLFENATDAIMSCTREGVVTDVNRGLERMLGWSRDEVVGQPYHKLFTPASAAVAAERIARALAGEQPSVQPDMAELEAVRKDGGTVPVEIRDSLLCNADGWPVGVLMMVRDITTRKTLERQRAVFLAMLTHDMKNPLTALLGYVDYLLEGGGKTTAAEQGDVLSWMKSCALTLLSLVNNYLDLLRIEDGQLAVNKQLIVISDLLSRLGRQYAAEALHRQVTLEFRLQKGVPALEADPLALERVFANLLYNALKFTPKQGRVTIGSEYTDNEVVVTVADTGPGIPPEEMPLLFQKYRQTTGARGKGGTGLGLF